jgi:hypothetical protein
MSQGRGLNRWDICAANIFAGLLFFLFMAMLVAVGVAAGLMTCQVAHAQQNHDAGHPQYSNWLNQDNSWCCNNQDCGTIEDEQYRESSGQIEVQIEGTWCPIRPWMYLKTGNVPDASHNHVCVRHRNESIINKSQEPCERLLCFQPKPRS